MKKSGRLNKALAVIRVHFIALVLPFILSWAFMGQSLTSCKTTVIGSVGGDHLSGIISVFNIGSKPYGGISHLSNYPYSENITQPQLVTNATLMVPGWIASKLVGPICSWNLMVLSGYLLSFAAMYCFIYWLTKRRSVALFAATAVAFTPYHYFKTHGHLSYVHSELFVAILWSFIALWRKPSRILSLVFATCVALLFYTDGYFPMIGGIMLAGIGSYVLGSLGLEYKKRRKLTAESKIRLMHLLVSSVVACVLLLPIVFVKLRYGSQIGTNLGTVRGNLLLELKTYGAQLPDYFVPSQEHPVGLIRDLARDYRDSHIYSNKGEYHLYLGYSVLFLAGLGVWRFWKTKKIPKKYLDSSWVVGLSIVVLGFAFFVSLVPYVELFGIDFVMPSRVIGMVTSFWRVYARLYLVVNLALVTIAAIGFHHLLLLIKSRHRRLTVSVLILAILIFEMLPINPISRDDEWSLTDFSDTYSWLGKQPEIQSVAAYPLVDPTHLNSSYFADQLVHKKPLFNSYKSVDSNALLHYAMSGIKDPQTLGALKTLGINHVLTYQMPTSVSNDLIPLHGTYGARVSQVKPSVKARTTILVPDASYQMPVISKSTQVSCRMPATQIGIIGFRQLNKSSVVHSFSGGLDVKGQPGQRTLISQDSSILADITFTQKEEVVRVNLENIRTDSPLKQYSINSEKLGYAQICNLDSQT